MKTNICSSSSFFGQSDATRHRLTPARRETIAEREFRIMLAEKDEIEELARYDEARRNNEIEYSEKR